MTGSTAGAENAPPVLVLYMSWPTPAAVVRTQTTYALPVASTNVAGLPSSTPSPDVIETAAPQVWVVAFQRLAETSSAAASSDPAADIGAASVLWTQARRPAPLASKASDCSASRSPSAVSVSSDPQLVPLK